MLKQITILELEKNGKKYPLHVDGPVTFAELFDIAYILRQFAIDGMNKAVNEDPKKEDEKTVDLVEEVK